MEGTWHIYRCEEEGETYIARSAWEAYAALVGDVGYEEARIMAPAGMVQLSEADLQRMHFDEDSEDESTRGKSFKEALAIETARPDIYPSMFSTDNN